MITMTKISTMKPTLSVKNQSGMGFAGAKPDRDMVHMVGVYSPGSSYLAEVEAIFTGVYNFTRSLRGKKQLKDLPLTWQKHYPKQFTPIFSTTKVPHYDLERSAFVAMQLRQPRKNNSVFMSFNQQRGNNDRTQYSLIATPNHGYYIGPPNAAMGSMQRMLEQNKIPFHHYAIDLDKVDQFLSQYQKTSRPSVNLGWAGRDIYGVVMGAMMAGLDPKTFAKPNTNPLPLEPSQFIDSLQRMSAGEFKVGETRTCQFMFDLDGPGDLKLGWALSKPDVQELIKSKPRFRIDFQDKTIEPVVLREKYQDAQDQEAVIISSSTHALHPNQYIFELGIRNGNIAKALGIAEQDMQALRTLKITRLQ